jgi:hypothetical protein
MVRLAGFEPTTPAFGGQYSIQLSYRRIQSAVIIGKKIGKVKREFTFDAMMTHFKNRFKISALRIMSIRHEHPPNSNI